MFEASLVNDAARTARPYTVSFSLVLQFAAAAVAVAYPLWHIEALPVVKLRAPSPFRNAIELLDPMPAQARPRMPAPSPFRLPILRPAPDQPLTTAVSIDLPQLDAGPSGPSVPGFFTGPTYERGTGGIPAIPPPQPPPAKPTPKLTPTQTGPVKVGGNVRPPQLLQQIKPPYPRLAVTTRIQGTVKIEAIISRDGFVRDARVVSGHPLLVAAALDAVRQWRYRPTILNEEPVEVALVLDVNFTLAR